MKETWKILSGTKHDYLVSNTGKVKSVKKELAQSKNSSGYLRVRIDAPNHPKDAFVHRLVAELFVPNPNKYEFVNHIDGNKENNYSENLEWCTRSQNEKHAWKIGLKKDTATKGEVHGMHKLTTEQVLYIRRYHKKLDVNYGTKALAEKFGVRPQTITNVVHRANWKSV